MNLWCLVGLHKWTEYWQTPIKKIHMRKCFRCNKIQANLYSEWQTVDWIIFLPILAEYDAVLQYYHGRHNENQSSARSTKVNENEN